MEMGLLMFMVPPGLTAGKDIVETILSSGPEIWLQPAWL
jgi:uncharacterized transporter YbjL